MEAPDIKENIKKLLDDTRKQEDELRKDREALERVARLATQASVRTLFAGYQLEENGAGQRHR